MASGLYDTIRKIAFPTSPNLTEGASGEDNRFILMMPGKVLNYQDYFPGEKYTKFVQVNLSSVTNYSFIIYRDLTKSVLHKYKMTP